MAENKINCILCICYLIIYMGNNRIMAIMLSFRGYGRTVAYSATSPNAAEHNLVWRGLLMWLQGQEKEDKFLCGAVEGWTAADRENKCSYSVGTQSKGATLKVRV